MGVRRDASALPCPAEVLGQVLGQGEAEAAELSGIRLAEAQLLQIILYLWPSMPYIKYCSCLGLVSR